MSTTDEQPRDLHRVAQLRLVAETAAREQRWADLLELADRLESEDEEYWIPLWGPLCAVAAHHEGRLDADDMFEAIIEQGFHQPEFLREELDATFAKERSWPRLLERMRSNVPPAPVEILDWPIVTPMPPLRLDRLDVAREERLRELLPPPQVGSWDTALQLLEWVSTRWDHANDHVERQDAVEVLELQDRYRVADRPTMNGLTKDMTAAQQEQWFWYFAGASTTGVAWAEAGFSPVFQGTGVVLCERLVKRSELVAPDLSEISMGIVDRDGPAALFTPEHPFSTGVLVTSTEREPLALDPGVPFPLTGAPGTHFVQVATQTRYGSLGLAPLGFTTR